MKKTLHIMPSGALWNRIALWWIGKELDKHDILQYRSGRMFIICLRIFLKWR